MPFYTWAILEDEDGRYLLIEYDNIRCDYPFATEFMIRL